MSAPNPDPRLAVIADVLPERTQGGELLLHRLLADYPSDRVAVVHGNLRDPHPDRQLPGVRYAGLRHPVTRLARSRFTAWYNLAMAAAPPSPKVVDQLLGGFQPDAVLTVPQGFLWRTAVKWAAAHRLPLHLIVHDDWPEFLIAPKWSRGRLHEWFGDAYRSAASRLCVSLGMVEEYKQRYGVDGQLLYPNRGEDSPEAKVRVRPDAGGPPVVAYAGSIPLRGYAEAIRRLAEVLVPVGGRVDLYGPHTPGLLEANNLVHPAIRVMGFLRPAELAQRVGETAHALLSPVSFRPEDTGIMRTLFPSKLVDYTAIGLPILIWGPEGSSAVRWAQSHPGAACLFTDPAGADLGQVVSRLAADPGYARAVAEAGIAAGERDFGLASARRLFREAINRGRPAGRAG